MTIVLSCAVVLACLALVNGENCQSSGDCSHVTCPNNDWIVACSQGQCTCNHPTASCSSAQECHHILHGCHRDLHCVDGQCACGGFGGPGGPGGPQ
ncbi:serine protease inhibitor Cvsi-2-like [Mya arenaria]|uniref:serine protease inhibitor Cvsi-2-like n=1 Tax=Mya arenaria TaxID=6604 RepID=UPI0022E16BB3|nr:serine protease inhibitor Cvsi-2-like [Mya arenaria]